MSLKCDVLIIGGGPIGLCCAYYLLKSGRKVTIVDAKEIGKGSGSGNAGHIVPSHIIPLAAPGVVTDALKWMLDPARSPFGMKIGLSPSYLSWLLRFVLACNQDNVSRSVKPLYELGRLSAENFARMIAEECFDCHYSEMGFLNLFKSEDTFHEAQREAEFMRARGIPVRVYDKVAVQDVEPAAREDVIGGVHYTGDAHLDPGLFLAALGKRVREMGAGTHADASVTGFVEAEGKVRAVRTRAGEFEAEQVVLAAGAWTPAVARGLGLDIPIQPGRGYSLTASAVRNMPRHALMLGDRRVAVSPLGDRIRVTGRLEVGTYSTKPDPRWIARLEGFAREFLRLDEKLEIQETWAGLRPITPDGVPMIGFSPRHGNLILATGHAMLGLSLGPGTGQAVAELANGMAPAFDLRPMSVDFRARG